MSPIPKFAQVLAKRAKAKTKVISGNPVTKKIASNQTKKFAKDDMELAKVRKQEIRVSLKKDLPKKPKDDFISRKVIRNRSDFINIARKLKDEDVKKFKEVTDFLLYIHDFVIFLEYAKKHLKKDGVILDKLICELKNLKISKIDNVVSSVERLVAEIKSNFKK